MGSIGAIFFDLDGTLVDSEAQTDAAIDAVLASRGVSGAHRLAPRHTRGRTWRDIVGALVARHEELREADVDAVEAELAAVWGAAVDAMAPIPGAPAAIVAAAAELPGAVAVVSSSPRALITRLLDRIGVREAVALVVGAEDVAMPKPDPACFLLAAERLGVDASDALVFEDSSAGLRAARAAGARTVAILCRSAETELCRTLATASCADFLAMPSGFWRALRTDADAALSSLQGRA